MLPLSGSVQGPANVEGINVPAWPKERQPFCNSTRFKYDEPLHLVVTRVLCAVLHSKKSPHLLLHQL
jgi:hypothetical protein